MMYVLLVVEQEGRMSYFLKPLKTPFRLPSNANLIRASLYINTTNKQDPTLEDLNYLCLLLNKIDQNLLSVYP